MNINDKKDNKNADQKEIKRVNSKVTATQIGVGIIVAIVVVTFIFMGGPLLGMSDFYKDLVKKKVKNEDGTFSIPDEAGMGVRQQSGAQELYIGRVLNEKIQVGKDDGFNKALQEISNPNFPYPEQMKLQYLRYYYEQQINQIVGMHNALKMNITISKNWQNKTVGQRYFTDSSGDINYIAMGKNLSTVNEYKKTVIKDLLYQNFSYDYFMGLPLTKDEVLYNYKLENEKITVKYVKIAPNNVDDTSLKAFYETNKNNYKMYKTVSLVFKDQKEAEKNLSNVLKDKTKFVDIGNKLKAADKIINIKYDVDYQFAEEYTTADLKQAIKATVKGDIYNKVIISDLGPVILMVSDIITGELTVAKVQDKVKSDYLTKNINQIDEKNKSYANEIYNLAKTAGFDKAAGKYNLKVETSASFAFMESGINELKSDLTDDANYLGGLFALNKNDIAAPFKSSEGYIISMVTEKIVINEKDFSSMYEDQYKKYSNVKASNLERDYYSKEKKKYEIIDNFYYVYNDQMFLSSANKNAVK